MDMTPEEMLDEATRMAYGSQALYDQCHAHCDTAERFANLGIKRLRNAWILSALGGLLAIVGAYLAATSGHC